MKPVKDTAGDTATVTGLPLWGVVSLEVHDACCRVTPRYSELSLSPKQARRLAKQLKRAADKAER